MKTFFKIFIGITLLMVIVSIFSPDKTNESPASIDPSDNLAQKIYDDSIKSIPIYTKEQSDSIEAEYKSEKLASAKKQLSKLIKTCDEFKNTCYYRHKSNSKYNNSNDFKLYIGESNGQYYLRLLVQYYAEDWLFVNSVQVKADDAIYDLTLESFERDNDSGNIWEYSDTNVDDYLLGIIETISESKSVKIRFVGTQYHDDRTLSSSKIQALREMIKIYKTIK